MGLQIESGTGNGKTARVTDNNKLVVESTSSSREHAISETDGLAFFANTSDTANTLTIDGVGTLDMLYLQNTSTTRRLAIEKIAVSSTLTAGVIVWLKNPIIGAIANYNTHIPVNINFSSGNTAEALCYTWNEVGTPVGMTNITGGTILKTFITNAGPAIFPIDGSVILGSNDSILIRYVAAGACEFECGLRFYFEEN